ncbi:hypothetical protein T12_629, partial [Trichinella patagoniensis]
KSKAALFLESSFWTFIFILPIEIIFPVVIKYIVLKYGKAATLLTIAHEKFAKRLSIMKQYIQAIYLLTFFISVPLQPGVDALFTEFLKSFGASENCPSGWSEWSECLGTETENVIHSLPAVCQATTIGRLIKAANRMVDSVLNYYRNVNRTVGPCGMCLKQVKCTNHCLPDGSLLIRLGKPYGVQERFCPGVEQSYACAVDSEIGYDPMTHECNLWPPKENTFPIRIPLQCFWEMFLLLQSIQARSLYSKVCHSSLHRENNFD